MLKIKLGEWYKTSSGDIVRVICEERTTFVSELTVCGPEFVYVVRPKDSDDYTVLDNGRYAYHDRESNRIYSDKTIHPLSLVEQLPTNAGYNYVEKEKWIPWTFETMPIGVKTMVKDKDREDRNLRLAKPNDKINCNIGHYLLMPYLTLFETRVQLDGTPCGTKVEK